MPIFLGLGANEGERREHLETAIAGLVAEGFRLSAVSPLVETPAMLPPDAEPGWNKPYLNCVIAGEADWTPRQGLETARRLEAAAGRERGRRWAPRPLDIDLLLWRDEVVNEPDLVIPHAGLARRDFVLTPLLHLAPGLAIPGLGRTVKELCMEVRPAPLWAGVLNLTPDSFSDGGRWDDVGELERHLDLMISENVQIIDVGAESTRPRAKPVSPEEEWRRLAPVLDMIRERCAGRYPRPWLSLDSRRADIVEKALDYGVDIINDVSGLEDPSIRALVRESGCQAVAMHATSVPADPARLLPGDRSAVVQVREWFEGRLADWERAGLDLDRIILDPGIGFGKSALQSRELLAHCRELRGLGQRLLVGHSRKSFMNAFASRNFHDRDMETLGVAMALCAQGVEIIRVHDPVAHLRAWRGWSHASPAPQ